MPAHPLAHAFFFERYNENHDPSNGEFSDGSGSGGTSSSSGTSKSKSAGDSKAGKSEKTDASGYTKSERDAFGDYINDSTDLNKFYRGGRTGAGSGRTKKLTDDQIKNFNEKIDLINTALKKNATSNESTVFRGMSECAAARDLVKNGSKLVGKDVPLGGFQSTSGSEEVAQEFVDGYNSPVVLEITVPKGTNIIDMSKYAGNFKDQREFLLGEGHLTITSVRRERGEPFHVCGTYSAK